MGLPKPIVAITSLSKSDYLPAELFSACPAESTREVLALLARESFVHSTLLSAPSHSCNSHASTVLPTFCQLPQLHRSVGHICCMPGTHGWAFPSSLGYGFLYLHLLVNSRPCMQNQGSVSGLLEMGTFYFRRCFRMSLYYLSLST